MAVSGVIGLIGTSFTYFKPIHLVPGRHLFHGVGSLHSPQVVFLAILNIYFYLDRRKRVLSLVMLFAGLNIVFSILSIMAGLFFYGYGFALSLVVAIFAGMLLLDRDLGILEYETFMLR